MANTDNAAALAFYVAQGFAVTGRRDFELDGAHYPNHVMRRALWPLPFDRRERPPPQVPR